MTTGLTLAQIRANIAAQNARQSGSQEPRQNNFDRTIYPFWNLETGKETTIRFLPDADTANGFFWVEKAMIKLPFAGIKGETDNRPVIVNVPCVEMYNDGSVCPILSEVRAWYKDASLKELANKYWKKRSYIYQGLVVEDGLNEEETPENAVRRFDIGPQLHEIVKASISDPDLEEMPTDYISGLDFRIVKGSKGEYADYSTSKFRLKPRPLSEAEATALDTFGLKDLKSYLPKKPNAEELEIIKQMFQASVDGEAYDAEAWGQYYRPAGMRGITGDPVATRTEFETVSVSPAVAQVVAQSVSQPVVQEEPTPSSESSASRADDILAKIRARQAQ